MKNILLVGDSIRIGYMPYVKELLEGQASVFGPEDNCRFARYSFFNLPIWIEESGSIPDIIHWNNGIWDVMHKDEWLTDDTFTTLDEYIRDIERIYKVMKNTGAKIIFATTTPVKDENPTLRNADIDLFNQQAVKYLSAQGVEINDLNAFIKPNRNELVKDDLTHLTEDGYKAAAQQVASIIKKYL